MSTTSGQFLTVPPLSHRSSHHHRRDSARVPAQSPQPRARPATRNVATSSRMKLEDTPLGMPVSPSSPPPAPPRTSSSSGTSTSAHTSTTTTTTTSSSSASSGSGSGSSPTPVVRRRHTVMARLAASTPSNFLPATGNPSTSGSTRSRSSSSSQQQQSSSQPPPPPPPPPQAQQLSPRSIFRAMPFLLRLRSPPSDLLNMSCTSGGPRTHAVLNRPPIISINKASQALIYNQTLVCEDAVNAEVLLRIARNELLERAQQADRRVTALVDEEWRYTIRQTKNGDYNVQVFYSACPAQCESQNSNETIDPRKPVALSHVTNIPGLMRVVHSE